MSVPQEKPLQPGPDKAQESAWLGLEFGAGVNVATMAALAPAETLAGAETVSEKWLVIVIAAEACFEGSATLWAINVSEAGEGRICGAVKFP